ncbi:hypothetical protein RR11_3617 [Ruegeria sp. R11]|jgi:hypothetical protein|nr:hypothetical protein RR11_3617 [Ruegeria sp. R11]
MKQIYVAALVETRAGTNTKVNPPAHAAKVRALLACHSGEIQRRDALWRLFLSGSDWWRLIGGT